ncbi:MULTISPECIES: hypothetical protein [unclassified Acinetobacter]|uniref:hypothetical protein n=1 Tax=unclassified Acinetobacter TaxID=196816 RepID=UPI002448DAF0|nr:MULTISPECIES: hypothetical protein [unclassified Acinetobacter]MDH0031531.1 hypothetical protein [Acinetobacter sp. GD04021]MDH0886874.1 hypothetical protein [Acinetobacter sp. GD03873]MDH1083313.1 hypothetical protein [Acinetobacter sp. GD03983]MDH2190190.1 hypothetical protein [Acinetobacter sp. GD03645]MDH2203331.1 hypothetical protein [Acinetobacter sp. GD03647]
MNKHVKPFLQGSVLMACLFSATHVHADLNRVMALINDPSQAPEIRRCQGKANCNAFVAISKEWQVIPKGDPLRYFIYSNDMQGLIHEGQGKNLKNQRLREIDELPFYLFDQSAENPNDYWLYLKGLVVLQYIERTQPDFK